MRRDADRALPSRAGRSRRGAAAENDDRSSGGHEGDQARRVRARDRRYDGAGKGHCAPHRQSTAGGGAREDRTAGTARGHQAQAHAPTRGQDAAPARRRLCACQAVQALEARAASPAHDPRRAAARCAAQDGRAAAACAQRTQRLARARRAHPHSAAQRQEQALCAVCPGGRVHRQGEGAQAL